jgi:hypothetical protein
MSERLAAALEFAELGCRAVIVEGKNPGGYLGRQWQQQATRDEHVLRGWWERWPAGNVGIVGDAVLLPLDVDDPASFERFQAEHGQAPPTPRYLTGGAEPPGRERLLFKHPGGAIDPKLADGVQLRRGNLMSLIPPSVHPETGVEQEWRIGIDEAPFAQIPVPWLERVRRTGRRGRSKSEWAEMFTRTFATGCGETHPSFVSMAGRLVPAVGAVAAFELLRCWNLEHCDPAKPEGEIHDAIAWVARKELGR